MPDYVVRIADTTTDPPTEIATLTVTVPHRDLRAILEAAIATLPAAADADCGTFLSGDLRDMMRRGPQT